MCASNCADNQNKFLIDYKTNFKKVLLSKWNHVNFEVLIKGQIYQRNLVLEEVDVLIRFLRKDWLYLQSSILNNSASFDEVVDLRKDIKQCLEAIVDCLRHCDCDLLRTRYINAVFGGLISKFVPLVTPISKQTEEVLMKLSPLSLSNEKLPVYHYFHCYLELNYYLLCLCRVCGKLDQVQLFIQSLVQDLVLLSRRNHKLSNKTIFSCPCTKNFCLFLQIFIEEFLGDDKFWPIFNTAVKGQENEFVLWLMTEVALLQGYSPDGSHTGSVSDRIRPNYPELETNLKAVLLNAPKSVMIHLKVVEPLLCNLWQKFGKIEPYQILWDYFSKRLNAATIDLVAQTTNELMTLVDTILWTPKECQCDFEYFLGMLASHLNNHPQQWSKMKGRIYSQLGPNKIKELNDSGIFHVCLLFLVLTGANFEEVSKKFSTFVNSLPEEKRQTGLVWRFYTSFFIRHIRENLSLEQTAPQFVQMIEEASNNHSHLRLIKNFVQDFDIIVQSSPTLQLHQWLLLDAWIRKYMTTCYHADLLSFLNILLRTLERIDRDQLWCDWEPVYKIHVYPTLKHVGSSLTAPDVCGALAAKIATLSPDLLPEAFAFFTSDTMVPKVSSTFLCVLLKDYPGSYIMTQNQEVLAIQSWVKACLLTKDSQDELTKNVLKLSTIPDFVKSSITTNRQDPLYAIITCLEANLEQKELLPVMTKLSDVCFKQADRWITRYLSQPDNDAITLRIFTIAALAFIRIGPLMYNRHKTSSCFAALTSAMLLPTEVMMGKSPNSSVLQAIKKTWPLFFEATLRMNSPGDVYIDRTLRDLVVKYVPHFSIVDSPMLQSLSNSVIADSILDKIAVAFLKQPTKEAESNVFKCLKILNEFIQSTTSECALRSIVQKSLYGLLEVVMFHNQRNAALNTIKSLASSPLYSKLKDDVTTVVKTITEKHLAFNTSNYFTLMDVLTKLMKEEVRRWLDMIKKHVVVIERMRGVGFDIGLRQHLDSLEAAL